MFGRKDSNSDLSLEQIGTIIGPGAVVGGPITTNDSARIDGTVNGDVTITGALVLGQDAKITGNVSCLNAYVAGQITGNVTAPTGKVEISDTGKVIGDVTCKGIIIDENAVFQGKCDMQGEAGAGTEAAKTENSDEKPSEEKKESSEEKK